MNVLSIDFDCLIDFTGIEDVKELLSHFPPGIDTQKSQSFWIKSFERDSRIKNLKVCESAFNDIKQAILNNQKAKAMISQSHKDAYHFILDHVNQNDIINLTHIDMHHDLFNQNEELDCGNWIGMLSKSIRLNIKWIANPISKSMYGLDLDEIKESTREIVGAKYDMIFMCRSDMWCPPQLDSRFCDLVSVFVGPDVTIEPIVKKERKMYAS